MFRLFIVLFAWKCVLICLEPFFLDLKGATATRVGKEFKRVISRCFRGFHWSIFWERSQRLPKCFVSEKKECQIDRWPSSIENFWFSTGMDVSRSRLAGCIIAYHFVSFYDKNPREIQSKFDGFCTTFLSLPSIIRLLWWVVHHKTPPMKGWWIPQLARCWL